MIKEAEKGMSCATGPEEADVADVLTREIGVTQDWCRPQLRDEAGLFQVSTANPEHTHSRPAAFTHW